MSVQPRPARHMHFNPARLTYMLIESEQAQGEHPRRKTNEREGKLKDVNRFQLQEIHANAQPWWSD
jgi:hypothetical protein